MSNRIEIDRFSEERTYYEKWWCKAEEVEQLEAAYDKLWEENEVLKALNQKLTEKLVGL